MELQQPWNIMFPFFSCCHNFEFGNMRNIHKERERETVIGRT